MCVCYSPNSLLPGFLPPFVYPVSPVVSTASLTCLLLFGVFGGVILQGDLGVRGVIRFVVWGGKARILMIRRETPKPTR